ncbi:CRP/FNR family transcriptional regulator, anaerobic regulatory protein/CRP/FNR family transcriptional regulator, nitrogen fixation regulation protein [Shimia gijangensis]|uniref:CRP/FNR family transcriptional regulator, anaerobic regulatory protein/CRP/FNR family transcriptional regulator, nitrogen fixation regulation protein n=1 Tax=Shimia gijangensis TaxID=1470563 RepID=A0A1M6GII7_9RHOB|nr:Crp/Fnr family transcriptional regulator [Shimia gijangensis]SHJ09746.1 CRP/FNR family transcriptional regulator, anaerobic regulatory protein/CRP/FNR family transcriptional regulator, nitrogen fixation regulation protein [Shimia gijangensis]
MQSAAKIDHPCRQCAFYAESVWHPVEQDSLRSLAQNFVRRDLSEGEVLFEQGTDNRGVFCVSRGLIALRTHHADGNSTLLRLAYPGEVIGFRSFLGDGQHQTEARALTPSRVCTVPRSASSHLLQDNPAIMKQLATRCVREIDRTHERICSAATKTYKEQLADLLMTLMDHHGEQQQKGQRHMRLPLSRSDLADLLGVQPETLSRLIKRLEKDGWVQIKGRHVTMLSHPLRDLSASIG